MNADQARAVFNAAIDGEVDQDRIANVELLREYFCNPEFRAFAESITFAINQP